MFSLSLFIVACGQGPKVAEVGKPAPDFTLVDLKGKTWTLTELKGQVVFVNFWATWCPPCREEMPSMQRLYTLLPNDRFKMLAILNKDDPKLADAFARKLGITMPILDDQANKVGPLGLLLGSARLVETSSIKAACPRIKLDGLQKWAGREVDAIHVGELTPRQFHGAIVIPVNMDRNGPSSSRAGVKG